MVEGLTHKLEMVASNMKTLVQVKNKHNSSDPEGSKQQMTNPLFEDNGGIQTHAVQLDFPIFKTPVGGLIKLIKFSISPMGIIPYGRESFGLPPGQ